MHSCVKSEKARPTYPLSRRQGAGRMAHRRLAEALQLSRDRVPVGCHSKKAEGESCWPSSLTGPHRVPLSKDAHGIFSLCFAPGGGQLAAGFGNGAVQLVDAVTGLPGSSLFPGHRVRHAVTAVKFHRVKPGLLLATGADGTICIYDLLSHYPLALLSEKENEINAMDFCRDGSTFATAGKDRHIRLYDSHTNQLFHVMQAPDFMAGDEFTPHSGHSRRIFALCFHPTELHLFLTGGWDNSVKVWDKRVPKGAQSVINGPHICGPGIDVKGDQVLTGSWVPRNALQLWDLRMSRLWQNLPFPGSPTQGEFLYSAQFCTGDVVLAGGSGSSGASAIHIGTGQVIGEILLPNKPVHVVASAPGGQSVAVAGAGGNLHLAELH
ncbi:small ribosomal subunit protein RACK1-like isoform X2 [Rhineura floridana]|uniref:small ribosomal subunit protein RACK1-like isoform X2 n=1 Tax=Rhineura floridana TaxID=261503 RepID=UPI002AC81944|nr:small ribosomal subunit protein RACK1-like isoform X2 [Rhineura floridana]